MRDRGLLQGRGDRPRGLSPVLCPALGRCKVSLRVAGGVTYTSRQVLHLAMELAAQLHGARRAGRVGILKQERQYGAGSKLNCLSLNPGSTTS